ncbi:hypothetical protein LCGC14_2848740 [marine sediment metagenome]|uniref:Uncharacterized protein n=1 Tax=marine sediment metagenome TaxID=412755 RepID=A0A0F9B004_9ZZZZ
MAKTRLVSAGAGVLVTVRPYRYFTDAASGLTHSGSIGQPGSRDFKVGDDAFRVSTARWARDKSLPDADRLFEEVS